METLFVDSNIPMYANGSEHPYKKPCQKALSRITHEEIPAVISSEILQEIIHRYLSLQRHQEATQVALDVMTIIPRVLPVTEGDVRRALKLIPPYPGVPARDLVHAAVMLEHNITTILSTDTHFDQVSELKRLDPGDFVDGSYNET